MDSVGAMRKMVQGDAEEWQRLIRISDRRSFEKRHWMVTLRLQLLPKQIHTSLLFHDITKGMQPDVPGSCNAARCVIAR